MQIQQENDHSLRRRAKFRRQSKKKEKLNLILIYFSYLLTETKLYPLTDNKNERKTMKNCLIIS